MTDEQIYIGIDISQDSLDMVAYPTGQIWQHKNSKANDIDPQTSAFSDRHKKQVYADMLVELQGYGSTEQEDR